MSRKKTTDRHQNIKDVHPEEQNLERNETESSVEPCKKESVELSESQIYSNSEFFFFFLLFVSSPNL